VGPAADLAGRWAPKKTIARPDAILAPGLVNTHTHAAMNLMRGISDDLPLMEWLTKSIFPAEARNVSPEFVKAGTTLACLEMRAARFVDMYYFSPTSPRPPRPAACAASSAKPGSTFPCPGTRISPRPRRSRATSS
jgi:5-methylthioadenosine/S-adenosylhomocysteine deaminase